MSEKRTKSLIIWLSVLVFQNSSAEEITHENSPCWDIYEAAASAIIAKEEGLSKDELLLAIPRKDDLDRMPVSKEKIILVAMHDIAGEVFENHDLDYRAYPAFKAENCVREFINGMNPIEFSEVSKRIANCKMLEESDRVRCGMALAQGAEPSK